MRFLLIFETNVSRYLAKSVEIFFVFEALKCDFAESWNPRFNGYNIFVNWKCDFYRFYRFVKTNVCLSVDIFFSKLYFSRVRNPRFMGILARVNIFSAFWRFVSIDGNWNGFWRKLDVLLKETGRFVDGHWASVDDKWMVYWRKLNCLLTETGWSIDANYWWNECSLFMETVQQILILGPENIIFSEIRNPRFGGHLEFINSFTAFWRRFLPSRETQLSRVPSFVWANFPHFGSLQQRKKLSSVTRNSIWNGGARCRVWPGKLKRK